MTTTCTTPPPSETDVQLTRLHFILTRFLPFSSEGITISDAEFWPDAIHLITEPPDGIALPTLQNAIINLLNDHPHYANIDLRLDHFAIGQGAFIYFCPNGTDSENSEEHKSDLYYLDGRQYVVSEGY